jgi:alpha(1,3/1,4) fucosyltransferase
MKKVAFEYWPREASIKDHFFKNLLKDDFDVKFVNKKEADILFFSTFNGKDTTKMSDINFNGTKVFWTGENCRIDMTKCNYAFGFDYENKIKNKKYLRLPLYTYYGAGKNLIKPKTFNTKKISKSKTKFCNYIYSKDAKERVNFFCSLDKYKRVDAPGKSMNNSPPILPQKYTNLAKMVQKMEQSRGKYTFSSLLSRHVGNWRESIINYQKDYKFTIAFENSSYPGYTTEKIYHPMLANSIPIYFGNEEIGKEFNTKSFVNFHNYNDYKKVVDKIIDIDSNEKKYLKILKEPWLHNNKLNKWMELNKVKKQLEKVFNEK